MVTGLRKFIVPLSVGVLVALIVVVYFVFLRSTNVYEAIPDSAVAVIEINDWSKFNNELNTKQSALQLKSTSALKKLTDEVAFIQRFFAYYPKLKAQLYSGTITISAHLTTANDFDYLFTVPANGINSKDVEAALKSHYGSSVTNQNGRIFKKQLVYDVVMKDGTKFCITSMNGILILSYTPFLTETSVTAITSGNNLANDKNLRKVAKKIDEEGAVKLFVNFKKADVIFPVVLKQQQISLLSDLHNTQSWAGYNIAFQDGQISFSGAGLLTTEQKTKEPLKNILANTIWNTIPDNAAYVNVEYNALNTETKVASGENTVAKAAFADWVGDAHAFITLEPLKEEFAEQNVFVVQVKDANKAVADLKKLIAIDGSKPIAIDTFMHTEIFNLKGGAVINQVFGSSFTLFDNTFFCITNNVAVFCNSADVLKFALEKISRGETLNKDAACIKAIEANGKTATGVIYINPVKSSLLLAGMIKDGSSLETYLLQQSSITCVFNQDEKWNITHGTLATGGGNKTNAGFLWKTKLQAISTYTPQIVTNETTGDKEIFVQDTANNIYLLSKSGEIIFTRNIGEKIIGNVQQLDYYNNSQLQYIFNTDAHIFMVDRAGNDAASYPLRLSNTATGGLTLINNNSKHRYFVPCSNGAIYGYEANGRPLSGWSPKSGVGLITKPLQHIKGAKGDYILAFNNAGKLILLGSKGEVKWSVDNLPVAEQNFSVVNTGDNFLVMNAAGSQLIEISADGNDNIKPVIDSAVSFVATETSDTSYQYFFSSMYDVRSYTGNGVFINAVSVKPDVIAGIEITTISNTKYLLVKDISANKILLYDLALKSVAEYPVANTNTFAIANLFDRNELIGIQPDANGNITCYRIK